MRTKRKNATIGDALMMAAGAPGGVAPNPFARCNPDDVTDRAKRYRARAHPPEGPKNCFACGKPNSMDIHHVNGDESDGSDKNKTWACRSCNVIIGNVMRKVGMGKLTRQYNPSGGATSLGAWMNAVQSMKGESGGNMSVADAVAVVRATSQSQRAKFAKEIWRIRGRRGNPANPADLAAEAFEAFHGYPAENETVFESTEHEHTVFAGIGDLEELIIVPEGESKGIRLVSFGGAQLTCNEQAMAGEIAQLYIVGGDQGLDMKTLRQFGIDPAKLHEQEVLGKCVDITYFTTKTHLGRDGGEADYYHKFGEESAKRKMRILVSPTATYHTVNRIIGLWGGKYTIEPEGIRN